MSAKFSDAASTATRTWPGPGRGTGTSVSRRPCGAPGSWTMARMVGDMGGLLAWSIPDRSVRD